MAAAAFPLHSEPWEADSLTQVIFSLALTQVIVSLGDKHGYISALSSAAQLAGGEPAWPRLQRPWGMPALVIKCGLVFN